MVTFDFGSKDIDWIKLNGIEEGGAIISISIHAKSASHACPLPVDGIIRFDPDDENKTYAE